MSDLKFVDTHNLVAFLEKPNESEGFEEIVDFMNANPIKYALTVNPITYCSCIKQFCDTVKEKTVNGEVQLQALVDKKKMYPRFVQVFVNQQVGDMSHHKRIYVTLSHTKKIFGNMKREGKGFAGRVAPLFQTMMVPAHEEMGEGLEIPTDPYHTPTITQPSLSQPQRKQKSRKSKKKNTEVPQPSGSTDNVPDENVPTTSNDPLLSGEDRLKLTELMDLCTNLQKKVLDLEKAKTAQDSEIAGIIIRSRAKEEGIREDASKQGRKIADIDADAEVTLIDETQGRNDDNLMFDTGVLDEQEVKVEKAVITEFEVTTEKKARLFVELLEKIKKHFAALRAQEKRIKPPTKAQKKSIMSTYLKHMAGYKQIQLKNKSFAEIQKLFDKAMTKLVEGSEKRAEDSTKRAGTELEQEVAKKQKIDDAKVDDDQEEVRMKELMNIILDEEEVAIDAIPLATKPSCIRRFGNSVETESPVWRTLQDEKVLIWKLFDSCGVHFLRLQSMHIFMLVEKRYPLTPATITGMLNKKLQVDH
ncbi:hypothetical protein Tco_0620884 [Tanacetum coccineum]